MITVSIAINAHAIYTRSAVNQATGKTPESYKLDTGEIIKHDPNDGAVVLAIKMLNTIKE
jgi:hypothetical protein